MKLEGLDWSSLPLQSTSNEATLPSIQIVAKCNGGSNRHFRVTVDSHSNASHISKLVNQSATALEQNKLRLVCAQWTRLVVVDTLVLHWYQCTFSH